MPGPYLVLPTAQVGVGGAGRGPRLGGWSTEGVTADKCMLMSSQLRIFLRNGVAGHQTKLREICVYHESTPASAELNYECLDNLNLLQFPLFVKSYNSYFNWEMRNI